MTAPPDSLAAIETLTLGHYQDHADAFWAGTKSHDVSQNINAFLAPFPPGQALDILDFGCGPGRDLRRFCELGHRPVGLDGCPAFCAMARDYSGCPVLQQQFLHLDLPAASFDGVYANASLFHVPSCELPRVLRELNAALRPGGVLFCSNPRGSGEGWCHQRYGHYMEFEASRTYLEQAGFTVLDHYYRPPGRICAQQPWLAVVARKASPH